MQAGPETHLALRPPINPESSAPPSARASPDGRDRLSRWQVFTAHRELLPDGVGIAPDVPVFISAEDVERGRDTILLTALELLQDRLAEAR